MSSTSSSTLSSLGVGSGIDANSIITQLMAIERRPIAQLQSAASDLDTKLSTYGKVQSYVDTLGTAAKALNDPALWRAMSASSSDSTSLGVTAADGATAGSYSVQVGTLAAAQMTAGTAVASTTTAIGQGTLHIDIGSWAADNSSFTPKSGSTTVDIDIGPGEDTLQAIRDKINAKTDLGVRASIVNDATGARLVLQSTTTGVANGFRVQVSDDDGNDADASGLSRLSYDPANGAAVATRSQAAANASATINGLTVQSATNTLSDVIDGVTLTLTKPTTSPVTVSVSANTTSMRSAITSFVKAYNDLMSNLRTQTAYNADSKTGGPLQGDQTALSIQRQVRMAFSAESSASSVFARASDLGLTLQKDGSISTSSSKLDAALTKPSELQKFFTASGTGSVGIGLAQRVNTLTAALLGTDGAITSREDGLRKLKTLNSDRQQQLEDRASATEARLRKQYQALDTNMARLNSLSNYVSQQITNWNKA